MLRNSLTFLLLPLVLAGCNAIYGEDTPAKPFTPVVGRASPSSTANSTIFVSQGETLYDVAKRYNVPVRDLIDANNLKAPYVVTAGQRLVLPVPKSYTVKAGDTIYGISRQYSMDMNEIVRLNNIPAPYTIRVGQQLRLPAGAGLAKSGVVTAAATVPAAPSAAQAAPARKPPAAPASAPAARSGVIESVPLDAPPATISPPLPSSSPPARAPAAAPAPATAAPGAGSAVAAPAAAPTQTAALPVPEPPPSSGGKLLWPVSGSVLSEFGPKPNGQHNDGINIVVAKGTAVKAADDGVVAYAGNELKGFGNLVLVRHADGWMTAYAHLDRIQVERGALVKRGQVVGAAGDSGNVGRPQLHFEVRRGSRAVDPRERLGPQTAKG